MSKVYKRLKIAGITYNKVDRGVYALVLQEEEGNRRIPIVIGMSEAQSIECKLQEIITPRPLTHDLIVNIMRAFGVGLQSVIIKQLEGGIFAADMLLTNDERNITIDARSSDAISIALRMGVPILTTEELLDQVGFTKNIETVQTSTYSTSHTSSDCNNYTKHDELWWQKMESAGIDVLETEMQKFVDSEEYENAARLKAIISRRNNTESDPKGEDPKVTLP